MDKYLIKNTTREQREQIVKDSLGYSDIDCDGFMSGYGYELYEPYINGEKEISEITQSFRASYVTGNQGRQSSGGCSYIR